MVSEAGGNVVVLGFFDGVHIGHQALLSAAREMADGIGCPVAVRTFETLPGREYLTPPPLREKWLKRFGADAVIADSFSGLKDLDPESFVRDILISDTGAAACVCGYNYHFGAGGKAGADSLAALCRKYRIPCRTVGEVRAELDGEEIPVCSTVIRRLISEGRITDADRLLGHAFEICGEVVHGRQFGRTVGLPTANILPPPHAVLPPDGVYSTFCHIGGKSYPSVTDIGVRPTFSGSERRIETHIIGFSGDLYGAPLTVGFISRQRSEIKFSSPEALVAEITRNADTAVEDWGRRDDFFL